MRSVSIVVRCDVCGSTIAEETEGESVVRFTARGVESEMDICNDDLYGTFLQEARPANNRRKQKSFSCHCGKAFDTQRGLSAHKTRQAHD